MIRLYLTACLLLLCNHRSFASEMPFNLTRGVTDVSHQVYELHMLIFYICCAIAALVFGAMFFSIIRHRKSRGAKAATFHDSTKVELLWTAIPFLILVGMAVPATRVLIAMEDTEQADLTILITGSQWKWHYRYLEHELDYYSILATPREQIENQAEKQQNYLLEVDRPLVLPTNRKVRFLVTSDDVIHSWWVPAFSVKKDANPGFINEAWTRINQPGIYRGQCAELCGKDHAFMPVVVVAKPEAEFNQWLQQAQQTQQQSQQQQAQSTALTLSMEELMTQGEAVYGAYCAACHQPNGEGLAGVFPGLKQSPLITGPVAAHIDIVVNGKPGTAMQAFAKQLSLQELAAVITYERNAWSNDSGDLVQAADVQQLLESSM